MLLCSCLHTGFAISLLLEPEGNTASESSWILYWSLCCPLTTKLVATWAKWEDWSALVRRDWLLVNRWVRSKMTCVLLGKNKKQKIQTVHSTGTQNTLHTTKCWSADLKENRYCIFEKRRESSALARLNSIWSESSWRLGAKSLSFLLVWKIQEQHLKASTSNLSLYTTPLSPTYP